MAIVTAGAFIMKALTTRKPKEEKYVTPNEEKAPSVFKKFSICLIHLYCIYLKSWVNSPIQSQM